MMNRPIILAFALVLLGSLSASNLQAQQNGGPTASPAGATVYFEDIKDGATIPEKATIHFGLRGMGIAPAGSNIRNAGHHHLLIDTGLPPLNEPIPSDFNHLHFGAGQTEAQVLLPPGEHTLQLLLGDKDHIPHSPPVMSERIRVRVVSSTVTPTASAAAASAVAAGRKPAPKDAKVYFVYPKDGDTIAAKTIIRFGLTGMGVAPAGVERANTGHHHLIIDSKLPPLDEPIPADFNHLHFGAGQTEAEVTLPLGEHTLQLLIGDENHVPHDPAIYSAPIKVTVTATGEAPKREVAKEPKPARQTKKVRRRYDDEGVYYRRYRPQRYFRAF
jgi:hypothetical protein